MNVPLNADCYMCCYTRILRILSLIPPPPSPSPSSLPYPSSLPPLPLSLPHDNMSYPVSAYDMQRTLPFFMSMVFLTIYVYPFYKLTRTHIAQFQEATVHVKCTPQSRQRARLFFFLQSCEWGPLTRRRVYPPPPFGSGGGTHSLA